ncbi:MAG: mechanosensitive ion channel family protein [Holosporales bacterium]|nr:mechanosensitive ion channel family protein [Holosporales bacterium]
MDRKQLKVIIAGLFITIILACAYNVSDRISPQNIGVDFDYEKVVRSAIAVLISIVTIRTLILTFIRPVEGGKGGHFSGILRYGIGITMLIVTAVFITTQIYEQSALVIFIGLGASGIGIAYIAQDFLKELFAGIAIAVQGKYRIGDWLKLADGTCAKIAKTRLTGIDLTLPNQAQLVVPNTTLTSTHIINLNHGGPSYFESVNLVLNHDVPVDRAKRIMHAALIGTYGIANNEIIVVAEEIQVNGILFGVYFKVVSFDALPETCHKVISAITTGLHRHGLQVCEMIGQMNVNNLEPGYTRVFNDSYTIDSIGAINSTGLLDECAEEIKRELANRMTGKTYECGEYICRQGEHGNMMYVIAEGVVDIVTNVTVTDAYGNSRMTTNIIKTLTGGDYVGEMAVLRGETRNADVVAKTDVVVYAINREALKSLVEKHQDVAEKLSTAMARRKLETQHAITDIEKRAAQKDAIVTEFIEAFKVLLGK